MDGQLPISGSRKRVGSVAFAPGGRQDGPSSYL